jgi:hypothetical protein
MWSGRRTGESGGVAGPGLRGEDLSLPEPAYTAFTTTRSGASTFASLITLLAIQSATAGDITVVGSLTREFSPALGSTTSDTISVRNDGSEPKDVLLYQVDYQYDAAGTNSFPSPGTLPRSNAPWVKVGAQQIRLDPGETEDVPYTLTVPSVVPVGGTQWSVIMIEPVTSRFDGERPTSDRAVTLNTIFRRSGGDPGR